MGLGVGVTFLDSPAIPLCRVEVIPHCAIAILVHVLSAGYAIAPSPAPPQQWRSRAAAVRRSQDFHGGRRADDFGVTGDLPLSFEEKSAQPTRGGDRGSLEHEVVAGFPERDGNRLT